MTSVEVVNVVEAGEEKEEGCCELMKPSAKNLENRASISSVDSSISLSYDAVPFTPRGSITISSSSDESRSDNRCSDSSDAREPVLKGSDSDEPFEPPSEELIKRIVDQVEYYFSDENIVKDAFLLKHVRRNKEGYVSLKLIASFKRVKHIARDWRVVKVALERSTKLEINESGTKLRRREPLPLYDQTTPSRTVVAVSIPAEKATIENVAELFRSCGEIALIRILRPGNPIPADVRPFYNKHPEMHDTVSALIEFVRTESAHNALNRDADDHNAGIQVVELNAPPTKKKTPTKKFTSKPFDSEFSSSCQSGSETDERFRLRLHQRRCSSPHMQSPLPPDQWSQRRWSRDSGSESPSSSLSRSRSNSGGGGAVYFIPDQRRLSAGWESSSESYSSCRSRSNSGASMPEVFQMRRYSLPRKEPTCCCCGFPKCESLNNGTGGRRYSVGRNSDDGYQARPISRCASGESAEGPYRRESIPEFYPLHRQSGSFERRPSLTKPTDGQWSRSSSLSSNPERRMSDSDGRIGLTRQRSFGNGITGLPGSADIVVRLPRGPDGGRGFQRELIEYALPE